MPDTAAAEAVAEAGKTTSADDKETAVHAGSEGGGDTPAVRRSLADRLLFRRRKIREAMHRDSGHAGHIASLLPKPDYSPKVVVGELAASSVDLHVRAWTLTKDYWGVFYDYNERFYNELPGCGISFPFPQLDVHIPTK